VIHEAALRFTPAPFEKKTLHFGKASKDDDIQG
jgi:hypothetical protein